MAFPDLWARRAPIVISAVGSGLVDFPVHLNAACFPSESLDSTSANKAKSDGGDLRFSSDAAGTVELPAEIRRWVQDASPANVRAEVHVKVPALSRTATTTIYVWYANAAATKPAATDPNGSQAVWDSGFVGVYHLDNTATIDNSTGGPAGTPEGTISATAESPVGLALDLDGVNDAISFGTVNTNNSTLELIVRPDAITDQIVIGKSGGSPASYSKGIWVSSSKPTAFFETANVLPYDMTVADSINAAQTATYEHWAIRNRASDAVTKALPAINQTHQARCSDGAYIYSIGGHSGNPSAPVTSNQRYDPAGNSWATLTAAPAARWGAACVHLAGKIYFMGGATNPSTVSSRNDIYDIAGNSWSVGTALPAALTASVIQGHRACTDGTYIYVFAGPALQRYDPVGNSWTALTTMPVSPGTWQSLICSGGSIYVIGGSIASTSVYRYDIAGGAWDGAAWDAAPYGAWAHVCEPVGDGSWLFGFGRYPSGTEQSRALYRYTPATKTWVQLDPYDLGGNAFSSGIVGGKLYVFGAWFIGRREDLTFGHHACYDITSGAWETSPAAMDFVRDGLGVGGMLSSAPFYAGGAQLYIGRQDAYGSLFSGAKVAEMRNSSVARSRDWLAATKQTLLSASTFSVVGTPEDYVPVFDAVPSGATVQSITSTGATPKCTITRSGSVPVGTLYYVIYPDGFSAPSAAQIIAGQDSTGAAATASGSEACRTTTGDQVFESPATGLTPSTAYRIAFVASDGVTPSAVAVSASAFTTTAETIFVAGVNGAQSNAGTAGSISQTHLISAASATQQNTGTAGSIATDSTVFLAAANATQQNTGTAGSISQTHLVAAASGTQQNTGTAGSISADGTVYLSAAGATQQNTGTAGSIAQTHRVGASAGVQDGIGTAGAILQTHLVACANGICYTTGTPGSAGDVVIADIALSAPRQRTINAAYTGRSNVN